MSNPQMAAISNKKPYDLEERTFQSLRFDICSLGFELKVINK
jgi:hypothetical protein